MKVTTDSFPKTQKLVREHLRYEVVPAVIKQKRSEKLQDPWVRLFDALFSGVPVDAFSTKWKWRVSRARNRAEYNPGLHMEELFRQMWRADMGKDKAQAILTALQASLDALYSDEPVCIGTIMEASRDELVADADEDLAQQLVDMRPDSDEHMAEHERKLTIEIGAKMKLLTVYRRFRQSKRAYA